MLKLELQESAAVALIFTAFAFTARMSLTLLHLHTCLTPWSVFQDGSCTNATNHEPIFGKRFVHCETQRTATCTRFPLNDFKSVSSPFEVLFNFPSWYLFAIGLWVIFSHWWRLPPFLRSTPKERDSNRAKQSYCQLCFKGLSPSMVWYSNHLTKVNTVLSSKCTTLPKQFHILGSTLFARR